METDGKATEVLRLLGQLGQIRRRDAFEQWRKMDVPLAQIKSLFMIHHHGSSGVRALAQDLGVTPSNITGIIDRLVAQELVSRTEDANDRRNVCLQLTEKGRAKIADIHGGGLGRLPLIIKTLPSSDLECLQRGLKALVAACERDWAERSELGTSKETGHPASHHNRATDSKC